MKLLTVLLFTLTTLTVQASDIKIIMPGNNYEKYSNDELRKRIYHLEMAVMQIQQKVFALEMGTNKPVVTEYTCIIKSFGKTFTASAATKMKAKADVMKECSSKTSSMHCDDDEVECDNK